VVTRKNVDELHHEIRIGARRRYLEMREDGARDRQVFLEDRRLVDENIRSRGREALVLNHPEVPLRGARLRRERDRLLGVAHIAVVSFQKTRRVERQGVVRA